VHGRETDPALSSARDAAAKIGMTGDPGALLPSPEAAKDDEN
jgi:hypothetical protein